MACSTLFAAEIGHSISIRYSICFFRFSSIFAMPRRISGMHGAEDRNAADADDNESMTISKAEEDNAADDDNNDTANTEYKLEYKCPGAAVPRPSAAELYHCHCVRTKPRRDSS